MAEANAGPLVIGHSWVSRLRYSGLLPGFSFVDLSGGTFRKLARVVESIPTHQNYDYVFMFLGGNDLDDAWDMSEIREVESMCHDFVLMLRARFPSAKLIIAQVEDRFNPNTWQIDLDFKRKSNKFNKWLNKFPNKEALFTLKGAKYFSKRVWFEPDGVHLNHAGNVKLASQIQAFYEEQRAG